MEFEFTDPACADFSAAHSEEEIREIVFNKIAYIYAIGFCTGVFLINIQFPGTN